MDQGKLSSDGSFMGFALNFRKDNSRRNRRHLNAFSSFLLNVYVTCKLKIQKKKTSVTDK